MQCKYIIKGKPCKLKALDNGFCYKHINYKFPKPKDCPVCLCSIHQTHKPLSCGHWVHKSCIIKSGQARCPICRYELDIKIKSKDDIFDELEIEEIEIPFDTIISADILYQIYLLYSFISQWDINLQLHHFLSAFLNDILPIDNPIHNTIINTIAGNIQQYYSF
jgi:hypothetical protein